MARRLPALNASGTCSGVREQITGEPTAQKARYAVAAYCLHAPTRRPDDACNAESVTSLSFVARAIERPNRLTRCGKCLTLPAPGRRAHGNVANHPSKMFATVTADTPRRFCTSASIVSVKYRTMTPSTMTISTICFFALLQHRCVIYDA
jgi:hypothetical protein